MKIPKSVVYDQLLGNKKDYEVRALNGALIVERKKLTLNMKIIEILRRKNCQMSLLEIQINLMESYGVNANVHRINANIGRAKEALIVDRGVYNLYANLSIDQTEIENIRAESEKYLIDMQAFVSSKII